MSEKGHSTLYFLSHLPVKGGYYEVGPYGLSFRASNLNGRILVIKLAVYSYISIMTEHRRHDRGYDMERDTNYIGGVEI